MVLGSLGPRLQRVTRAVRRKRSLLTSNVDEQIHSLAVVQVFGRSGGEYDRLSRQNDALSESLAETARIRARMLTVSSATSWLVIIGVLWVGALEIAAGNASVGVVATAMIAARQLTGPVRRLGLSYDYWQRAQVSRKKLVDFLASSSRDLDDLELQELRVGRAAIEIRNLSVKGALSEVTGHIPGGQMLAVVGPNGAGKSTLLGVVAGLIDPDSGEVLIDGHPTSERTLRSRFRRVGMVSADLSLMAGTVRRNLTYRCPDASDEEVSRVVAACQLDDVIGEFPGGLDEWLTTGARNLSLGERQRLSLARALMGNPPILLLDEPTANLDQVAAEVLRTAIARHKGTVIVATHDEDEAAIADHVWVLEDGRIAEQLTGEEYRDRLWRTRTSTQAVVWRPQELGAS
jgi:ATP-binding cassette subfamily B protein